MSAERAEALHLYNQRVNNAVGGFGFLTNAEVREITADAYVFDPETNTWQHYHAESPVISDEDPFDFLNAGARDSWPPDWPLRSNGYDPRYGWKTQPAPQMEQFPEK